MRSPLKTHRIARLPGNRLHLQEGPSDLVIAAFGPKPRIERAYAAAEARFDGLLTELAGELRLLRQPLDHQPPSLRGATAQRMARACWGFRSQYITPMAAVAGAVADTVLTAMLAAEPRLERAYVNNGGDIALHVTPGHPLDIGVVPSLARARPEGFLRLDAASHTRGVATSGWRGRSFSLGIADAVTVLARSAAEADAAATIIANAVDVKDAAILRRPARELDPDSDLRELLVTVEVGPQTPTAVATALGNGVRVAETLLREGLIEGALLALADEWRSVGGAILPRHGRARGTPLPDGRGAGVRARR
ncbi:ApbE superfamily uncharacterized protein (UPF0280 family) [Bosea sp. BE125]|uniref:UPF0280 family protein n=1 Tax=Bosea sp. BE125 TaxID=2817909 RepID=UPI0028631987|nr:UPF0280 family protein [Bosea sp. BE125]MDR6870510.1 ApbE superfamily uncharacterized protein (UPF0280 family) [Bosea sp. BE125]